MPSHVLYPLPRIFLKLISSGRIAEVDSREINARASPFSSESGDEAEISRHPALVREPSTRSEESDLSGSTGQSSSQTSSRSIPPVSAPVPIVKPTRGIYANTPELISPRSSTPSRSPLASRAELHALYGPPPEEAPPVPGEDEGDSPPVSPVSPPKSPRKPLPPPKPNSPKSKKALPAVRLECYYIFFNR